MTLDCPECHSSVEFFLVPSEIVTRMTIPGSLVTYGPGSRKHYYQEATPRRIGWNCLNPACSQSAENPQPVNQPTEEITVEMPTGDDDLKDALEKMVSDYQYGEP